MLSAPSRGRYAVPREALSSRLVDAALASIRVPSADVPAGARWKSSRAAAPLRAPTEPAPAAPTRRGEPRRRAEAAYDPGVRPYETPQGLEEAPAPEPKPAPAAPPKKDKRKIIRRVLLIVIILTFVSSVGYIGWYLLNSHNNAQMASELSASYCDIG